MFSLLKHLRLPSEDTQSSSASLRRQENADLDDDSDGFIIIQSTQERNSMRYHVDKLPEDRITQEASSDSLSIDTSNSSDTGTSPSSSSSWSFTSLPALSFRPTSPSQHQPAGVPVLSSSPVRTTGSNSPGSPSIISWNEYKNVQLEWDWRSRSLESDNQSNEVDLQSNSSNESIESVNEHSDSSESSARMDDSSDNGFSLRRVFDQEMEFGS